jgi:D-arabinose 1-dehydrogenase-like Zn-dependent alcohol dehydrogenase
VEDAGARRIMKATVYELTAPRTLVRFEADISERALAPNEIVATTEFTVVSPGTELAAWVGRAPLRPSVPYPRLVGYCNVARVLEVGSSVTDIARGDHVLTHQSHRSHFRCDAATVLLSVNGLDLEARRKLATVYLYHLGYVALLAGGYVPGHDVALIGFGALGFTTAGLVSAFGGEPTVFSARSHAHAPKGVRVLSKTAPASEWLAATSSRGFDLVVDTSDSWEDYRLALTVARKGGTIVLLGFPGRDSPRPEFNPLDSQYLYDKQLTVRQAGYVTDLDIPAIDARFTLQRNVRYLFGLATRGVLDPSPLLALQANWRNLGETYESLLDRAAGRYTAVIDWTC